MNDRRRQTKNVSRKHHFVPRWYLRHWCGFNGRVLRARKTPSGILFDEQLPENIGCEKDLNTVFGTPGNRSLRFEDEMTRLLDDPFSALHQRMIAEGVQNFTDAERFEVARHLCALQLRNPRTMREIEQGLRAGGKYPSYLSPSEVEELRELERDVRQGFKTDLDFSKAVTRLMLHMLDEHADILVSKTWVIVPYPEEKGLLVTSEFPFISTQDFGSPESLFVFPVTPSLVLVIHEDVESLLKILPVHTRPGFAHLNFVMVSRNEEVYFRNPAHRKFIERYLGCFRHPVKDKSEVEFLSRTIVANFLLSIPEYMNDHDIDVSERR